MSADLWAERHFQPPGGVWTDEAARAHLEAMRAANKLCTENYTRLYTPRGRVRHLAPPYSGPATSRGGLCSVVPKWPGEWLGTGSQEEYELAAEMPTCKRCDFLFARSVRCGNPQCPCQYPIGDLRRHGHAA